MPLARLARRPPQSEHGLMDATETRRFGIWLDRTMINHGLSGIELARMSGLDEGSISRWRHGRARPSLPACEPLAEALGVDPQRLAKTAGLLPPRLFPDIELFPLPPRTGERARLQGVLRGLGLSEMVVDAMLEAFDVASAREDDAEP